MFCGRPSGMLPLDPWSVPPGVTASLVVRCAECRDETKQGERWAASLKTGTAVPPGEPPEDPEVCAVMVMRYLGSYASVACDGGVIDQRDGWTTMGAAFEHGARVIAERRGERKRVAGAPPEAEP
jgi:hypothetical protein